MAEPLKNKFGPEIPVQIARMIAKSFAAFDQEAFVGEALDGYDELALLPRGWKIAHALRHHLPDDYEAALARLAAWPRDPSPHVRRLVSEGTRPRLPWAPHLEGFRQDPRPVLTLLELLKDDPELYVRRSVANKLNDIGKDHPALLVETAGRWLIEASEARRGLVRHALRSALKRADPGALAVMGLKKHRATHRQPVHYPEKGKNGRSGDHRL